VTIVAGAYKHRKRVPGDGLAFHGVTGSAFRPCQVAFSAVETGITLAMDRVGVVLGLVFMAAGAQGVCVVSRMDFLGMHLMTGCAGHSGPAVTA
jgi:hypothetical protein